MVIDCEESDYNSEGDSGIASRANSSMVESVEAKKATTIQCSIIKREAIIGQNIPQTFSKKYDDSKDKSFTYLSSN